MANGFDERSSVQRGLDMLAERLDPIIERRLNSDLDGLPWTAVLQELDAAKGYTTRTYTRSDLQAQLRMLTERLGNLGYPFDDPRTRIVTTLGGELRIMRNRWAHNMKFDALDAFRTHDFIVRLLEYFDDDAGRRRAESEREKALTAYAQQTGIKDAPSVPSSDLQAAPPAFDRKSSSATRESEYVEPSSFTLQRRDVAATPKIGRDRSPFEPWHVVSAGPTQVLDDIAKNYAKDQVRSLAVEITNFEGPIHIDRLAALVAASFEVTRLHARRKKQLRHQICATDLERDSDNFLWPAHIDRSKWREFRPNDSDADRPFTDISIIEIANAARFIRASGSADTRAELEVLTLQTFGRKRRTAQIRKHLERALKHLEISQ